MTEPQSDVVMTTAAAAYFREQLRVSQLWSFMLSGALALSGFIKIVRETSKTSSGAEERIREQFGLEVGQQLPDHDVKYGAHRPLIAEVMLCRHVDNFLTYVVELLALIYERRPEMLRSGEQVSVDFVLQYDSMEAVRRAMAERRVDRLAYLGMRDLAKTIREQHGFDLLSEKTDIERTVLVIEMRNLIVHNRGIVSKVAANRAPELANHIGSRVPLTEDQVRQHRDLLDACVKDIDSRASEKFGLTRRDVDPAA